MTLEYPTVHGASTGTGGEVVTLHDETAGVGGVTDFDVSGLSQDYDSLVIKLYGEGDKAAVTIVGVYINLNNDAVAGNYHAEYHRSLNNGATHSGAEVAGGFLGYLPAANAAPADTAGYVEVEILNYTDTTFIQPMRAQNGNIRAADEVSTGDTTVYWKTKAAVNRVKIYPDANNFVEGTRLLIYGVGT